MSRQTAGSHTFRLIAESFPFAVEMPVLSRHNSLSIMDFSVFFPFSVYRHGSTYGIVAIKNPEENEGYG